MIETREFTSDVEVCTLADKIRLRMSGSNPGEFITVDMSEGEADWMIKELQRALDRLRMVR